METQNKTKEVYALRSKINETKALIARLEPTPKEEIGRLKSIVAKFRKHGRGEIHGMGDLLKIVKDADVREFNHYQKQPDKNMHCPESYFAKFLKSVYGREEEQLAEEIMKAGWGEEAQKKVQQLLETEIARLKKPIEDSLNQMESAIKMAHSLADKDEEIRKKNPFIPQMEKFEKKFKEMEAYLEKDDFYKYAKDEEECQMILKDIRNEVLQLENISTKIKENALIGLKIELPRELAAARIINLEDARKRRLLAEKDMEEREKERRAEKGAMGLAYAYARK